MDSTIIVQSDILVGKLSSVGVLNGTLTSLTPLAGRVSVAIGYDFYTGEYEVTPSIDSQKLETKGKVLADDVTIKPIPYYEVSNPQGGITFSIGADING